MGNLRANDPGDLQDIGCYLQSLMQIMAVDGHLHEEERQKIRVCAERMGFEKKFVENTITDFLDNKHMLKKPYRFNSPLTAKAFLNDAIDLAISDGHLHRREYEWLLDCARTNDLDLNPILARMRDYLEGE